MSEESRRQARFERESAARRARQDWFARQLGDEWESDGTGIYRFVGDRPEPASEIEPVRHERLDQALLDATSEPKIEESEAEPGFEAELEIERRGRWRRR